MDTLQSVFESVFGDYNPIVTVVDSTTGLSEVSPDWGYILPAVAFILFIYAILRILGGVFKK